MTERQLLEALADHTENLDTIITLLNQTVENACKELAHLKGEVDGNGKTGLKMDVSNHLVRHDERDNIFKAIAVAGGGGGLLVSLINLLS